MSYLSHSEIWVLQQEGKLYIGGRTNRAQVAFERELLSILDQLNDPSTQPTPQPELLSNA
jgi:cytochrome c biogenesis protein